MYGCREVVKVTILFLLQGKSYFGQGKIRENSGGILKLIFCMNHELVLRIFCDSTAAALQTLGRQNEQLPNWEGTLVFVKTILKFWNIVTLKSSYNGKHKRLDDANPIRDLKDTRISWMFGFVSWLQDWK